MVNKNAVYTDDQLKSMIFKFENDATVYQNRIFKSRSAQYHNTLLVNYWRMVRMLKESFATNER
tara:strand:+ start:624 stop:815 length:192 start_codon:yes stop_codon:yes gene_type:complete